MALNRSSRGALDRTSSVRSTCSASGERQPALELLEGGGEVRVVLVGVADHQPGRQDDGHRLGLGQLERRQERLLGIDPPDAVLAPDRQPELLLDRVQVAVDGPHGHPDPGRDVAGPDALGMGLQDRHEPGQPGEPVALRRRTGHARRRWSSVRRIDDRILPTLRGGQPDVDRPEQRVRDDPERLAVERCPRPGRARRRGRSSSRAGRASGAGRRRPDQPARPAGTHRRTCAVDRDPAAPGAGALDDLDATVLGRGPVARRQRDLERLEVDRVVADLATGRPAASRSRAPTVHASFADPRRSVLAELAARGDVGEPAEVIADAPPASSTEPSGRRSIVASRCSVEPRRRSGDQRPVAQRRRPSPLVGPNGDVDRRIAQGDVVGDRDRREGRPGQRGQRAARSPIPPSSRWRRSARRAAESPGDPEAAEQARRQQREQPRIGRLDRWQERPRPERQQLGHDARDRRHEAQQRDRSRATTMTGNALFAARDRRPDRAGERDARSATWRSARR